MQEVIRIWKVHFFTEPILGMVLLIALVIALKNRKRHNILKYIPIYIIAYLLIIISGVAKALSREENHYPEFFSGLNEYIDYFFTLIEMVVFSHFYYQLTNNYYKKKIILIVNALFIAFFLFMLFMDKNFYSDISEDTQQQVYTVEGILLLPICLAYFIRLFKKPAYPNLKTEPSFWVSVGLLFFLTCTLPYSILEHYVSKKSFFLFLQLYSIFYIFYILLFLMIIRAYLCKPEKKI